MKVTVLVDKRERRKLIFPATVKWYPHRGGPGQVVIVKTREMNLDSGDYALDGYADRCTIERKGSLDELSQNLLSDDYARAFAAFTRFATATEHPYLLLECSTAQLRSQTRWTKQPERVVDALAKLMHDLKLRLILCGRCSTALQKRTVGEFALRIMMAHSLAPEEIDNVKVEDALAQLRADCPVVHEADGSLHEGDDEQDG